MIKKIVENVYDVGAIDWDRTLFDEIIPLNQGTSYNAYLIIGSEKTALIDTVDPPKFEELWNNLKQLNVKKIDYIISNHAEQDHSGSLPMMLEKFPEAKVVTNLLCKNIEKDLLGIPDERFIVVKDDETLSLGNKTLQFILTPWVHWPETMVTYLVEDKILFSCDFFGSHVATSDTFNNNPRKTYLEAKRYFAEIMMPFSSFVKKNIEKISKKDIVMIAPSHGVVYDDPDFIINAYKEWIDPKPKNRVLVAYVSMHGSTKKMVDYFADSLSNLGLSVQLRNLVTTDLGELAIDLVDVATIVLATPTMLNGPHPSALYAAYLVNALKPKAKFLGLIGSYSWGGRTKDVIVNTLSGSKAEILPPVLVKGYPKDDDFKSLDELASTIKEKHNMIFTE